MFDAERYKDHVRRARRVALAALGRDVYYRRQTRRPVTMLGGGYGEWGLDARGLMPDSVVYSFGIGMDISFDLDLIERFGCEVHAFDPTPEAITWVRGLATPAGFASYDIGLAGHDGREAFNLHREPGVLNYTVIEIPRLEAVTVELEVRRLSTIMEMLGHDHVDVLKMDIEGSEYGALDDILDSEVDVRQILVEFHHRLEEGGFSKTRRAVGKLGAAGYKIYHVSPRGENYSFIKE